MNQDRKDTWEPMKSIFSKVMRVGRATVFTMGLAVVLTVMLGVATTALAAVPGAPFKLGKVNAINEITKLVGKANSPRLVIDNNGSGVALSLQVQPGRPPMQVNSTEKVAQLNADSLDGLDQDAFLRKSGKATDADTLDRKDSSDFLSSTIYVRTIVSTGTGGANQLSLVSLSCADGDILLSGGYTSVDEGTHVTRSLPSDRRTWHVEWRNDATADSVGTQIVCIDMPS